MEVDHGDISATDIELAADVVAQALRSHVHADWTAPAGNLAWSCWSTLAHAGDCVAGYAWQLAGRATDSYLPARLRVDEAATPAQLLPILQAAAGVLAATCRDTPAGVRAFHPSGMADAAGFAAMGTAEILIHGADVAQGLGVPVHVEPGVSARVLARLFPDVALAGDDAWPVLQWAHGRLDLPGRVRRDNWQWSAAPPGER